jgi:hypothetical protein
MFQKKKKKKKIMIFFFFFFFQTLTALRLFSFQPLGWRPLHFAAKSNRAELIPMLLRRGADVSSLCTLDGSPAAPQMTPLEVAKHFKSTLCIEVLEKSAQRGGASSGISASLDDAAKPALANHASGRAIRRTQAGTDVKNTRAPAVAAQPSSTDLGASNNKLSPGYDVVPGQPVNQRPIGPGYQGLPPADAKNRPPAALPPGATPPFGGVAEVQSEYDAVPKELRASLASSTSTAAIGSPRYGDVTALADGGNEYDSVPTELHSIKALKEQSRVQQRKSADLSSEYGKAPPPANGGYLSANVPPPSSTGTLPSFASSSEYAKAPVPLAGFDSRYGAVPGERPPADDDNQYDSIPNELVGTAALKGYTAAPAMSVGVGRSPMRANTGGVPAPVAKPPKPSPPAAQPPQQQPPQQQQQTNSPNDPAASRDFKVALSTARIGRHFKSGWSRTDAENFLRGKPANTFVLRPTTQKGGLITLSFVHPVNGSVQHSLIYDRDGGFTFDEEFGCPPAKSLLALLQWQKLDV